MVFYKTTKVKPPDSRIGFIILSSNHTLRSARMITQNQAGIFKSQ